MDDLLVEITDLLEEIQIDFGGGCSVSKAYVIAYLIRRFNMKATLDIGVYRGRSLFPQAFVHKRYTGGIAYGIDPWSKEEAREYDNPRLKEKIDNFISDTDFEAIYNNVEKLKRKFELEHHCVVLRMNSEEAAKYFMEENIFFDLIHIDGNHDTAKVMKDIEVYLARLNSGGILVMDDISWASVKPAYYKVSNRLPKIFQHIDAPWNDYAVFWNINSPLRLAWLRLMLKLSC